MNEKQIVNSDTQMERQGIQVDQSPALQTEAGNSGIIRSIRIHDQSHV